MQCDIWGLILYSIVFQISNRNMVKNIFHLMLSAGTNNNANTNYGYLPYILAFLSSIIWPLSWLYPNQHHLNMSSTTLIRGFTNILTNYIICIFTNSTLTFSNPKTFQSILIRSIIISITSLCIGLAQYILPLSIVHTIISSSTLIVFIIDFIVNDVRVNLKQGVGITIGIIGMMLASNGRFIQSFVDKGYKEESKFMYYITDNVYYIALFTLFFIFVIALWSYAFVLTKTLKYNPFQINYFTGLTLLFSGTITLQFLPQQFSPHSITAQHNPTTFYLTILYTGIPLLFDQWFLVAAVIMAKQSGIIAMMSYNSIIIAYIVSIFRYGEKPNMFTNVGVVLLAVGMYQTLFNMERDGGGDGESVSGEDNQDGTFRKGIHRSMKHTSIDSSNKDIKQLTAKPPITPQQPNPHPQLLLRNQLCHSD